MKTTFCSLILGLMLLSGCNKDEFQTSFVTPSKLIVSIKEDDQLIAQFKYDTSNRLIRADRYLPGNPVYTSQFFEYNSQNQLISKTFGEFVETYTYNTSGRLVSTNLHFKSARDGYEWDQKTDLQYNRGRISKGIIFSRDGVETGRIEYKYDSRGNTTERTEYPVSSEYNGMILSQVKFTYDDKINPFYFSCSPYWEVRQSDIVQGNNPSYSYYYNSIMSSFPPEYEFTYEYDTTGLPVKVFRKHLKTNGITNVYEYEYIDKSEQ